MSSTVAKAIRTFATVATADFIELIDKMFDSMNVLFLSQGKSNRKVEII